MKQDKQIDARRNKVQQRAGKVAKTDVFTFACHYALGVDCKKEYIFHPTRKWRFDYAIPKHKIAIEIDGGVWTMGRHNRPTGYLGDLAKFNAAAELGWLVLKFTPQQQYQSATFSSIRRTIQNRLSLSSEGEPKKNSPSLCL